MSTRFYSYLHLMRIHKPIGFFLLLWPSMWALWIAAKGLPSFRILIVFLAGTFLMRSAGCVINDIADRNFDPLVTRTKDRPLAAGNINLSEALVVLLILLAIAFVLVCFLNSFTILLSLIGLFLALIYPFMKRFTYWPQFFLGLAFAWSIPMAFAAVTQHIPATAWLLFLITMIWTLIYDTQYAMVDREDDLKIGIKSTAILFDKNDVAIISLLQIALLILLLSLGILLHAHFAFYIFVLMVAVLCLHQYALIHTRNPQNCLRAFSNNHWLGILIMLSLITVF